MKSVLKSLDLREQASDHYIVGSAILMLVGHALLWAAVLRNHDKPLAGMLNNWDAGHYTNIIDHGYQGISWAFFPLYPMLVKAAGFLTGGLLPSSVTGTLMSVIFFGLFVAGLLWIRRGAERPDTSALLPETRAGWLLFLFAPCSYVFHSHHTESLFMLLMLAAFYLTLTKRWLPAAVAAGLAALTRNQGVLLAVACGIGALMAAGTAQERLRRFVVVGVVSAAIFSVFLIWQYIATGDPFTFVSIQKHWRPEVSYTAYFKTFWFGNPWQNTNSGSVQRLIFFLLLVVSVIPFAVLTRQAVVSAYMFLHILIMPAGGDLIGAFRYGTVMFPLLFFMGDRAALATRRFRFAGYALWPVMLYVVWFNFNMTRRYALMRWSY